jgi:hypothetical protein
MSLADRLDAERRQMVLGAIDAVAERACVPTASSRLCYGTTLRADVLAAREEAFI